MDTNVFLLVLTFSMHILSRKGHVASLFLKCLKMGLIEHQDKDVPKNPSDTVSDAPEGNLEEQNSENIDVSEGDFVAALYDSKTLIGKVVDIDEGQYEISFMESVSKVKNCLKWPKREARIQVEPENIIAKVNEPVATGRGKRMFKLSESDRLRLKEISSI